MSDATSLTLAVNELLKTGWEPIGSHVAVIKNTNCIYNEFYPPSGGPVQKVLMNTYAVVDYTQTMIHVKKPSRF
jgi:hypothetical protein